DFSCNPSCSSFHLPRHTYPTGEKSHNDAQSSASMNTCLQAPEILQLICDQLPNEHPIHRQRLLAVALSCRALLEPALDRLWHRITSFRPLVTTLPRGLWKVEREGVVYDYQSKWTVLGLTRAVKSADLDRYLTYYAQRIREVDIQGLKIVFSSEGWHGLQMATGWRHGSLSPSAYKVSWPLTEREQKPMPREALNHAFPFFSLFLGPKATHIRFVFNSNFPIQASSIESAANICSALKTLNLKDDAPPTSGLAFLGSYLQSSSWANLSSLTIVNLLPESIAHLSTCPQLSNIEVSELKDIPCLHTYSKEDLDDPPAHLATISRSAFQSLKRLTLCSMSLKNIEAVIQYLPPCNRLHTLKCFLEPTGTRARSTGAQNLLNTVGIHCNSDYLRKLVIKTTGSGYCFEEGLEAKVNQGVNLRAVLDFKQLKSLTFDIPWAFGVNLTKADINNIVKFLPSLVTLKIDTDVCDSRHPLIDHTHVLKLLYGLNDLKKLGLRFNAIQVEGDEEKPGTGRPAPLEKFWVGDSPIYSPKSVSKFLKAHCPKLQMDDLISVNLSEEEEDSQRNPLIMYERRWSAVGDLISNI
ncbi:hypothetical protein DFP72DRAFT_498885, partial [Ephemerocybe angulata]